MPYIRMPEHVDLHIDAQEQWLTLIYQAEQLLHEDGELQAKAKLGLRLKDRKLPSEVLGRNYVQYCNLINKMYDAYLKNVQLQRAGYMMEVISVLMMRLFELRNELVHLIVNDYIYVDSALTQLRMTPYDIQIIVPHHIPLEARPEVMETLFEKMSAESTRRLRRPPKKPQPKPPPSPAPVAKSTIFEEQDMGLDELEQPRPPPPPPPEPVKMEEEEEEEITPTPSVHTVIPEEFIQSNIIQTMERYRQFYTRAYEADCNNRRLFFAPKIQPAPLDFKNKAARLIQDIYRKHMTLKRKYAEDIKRDIILGILPDREKKYLNLREETVKLYDLRRKKREKVTVPYKMDYERETLRLLRVDKDNHIEDITEEIREWFMEWYFGYGFFPQYPLETEGGTILVVTGQYPTIEEKQEEDEAFKQKTKGKTKDQLKEERKQAAFDKAIKAEQERDKQKNIALAMFKARCNPFGDPGYEPKASEHMDKIVAALTRYRQAWSIYDQLPLKKCKEVIYGYMMPLVTEDIVQDMHLECRKLVDEMMRLELKLFVKAQQAMFKRMNWKYPKFRPRKRPKIAPVQIPFVIDDKVLKNIEAIFDSCIMSRPKNKIEEVLGDLNFAAANLNVQDPDVRYPSPGYGDVRRRLILSCVFGCVEPLAPQNKSVLLLGPRKNGKSFLADVVAGEMNAIKFDISPEAFSSKVPKPGRLLRLVFVAARVFQPAVIFCKDIERVFYKKVPPADRKLRPTAIKRPLVKEVKAMKSTDKVIFIGTCSDPFVAKARPMVNIFTEVLLVPIADYGTLQMFFANKLQSIRSMPKDYVVQPLAKLFDGFGFGVAMDLLNKVLTPERIIRLNVTPLSPTEFLEYMIENEMVPLTREEYQKYIDFVLKHSKLYKERMEYDLINWTRKQVYDKIAKKEAAKAAKAEAAKAAQAENKG